VCRRAASSRIPIRTDGGAAGARGRPRGCSVVTVPRTPERLFHVFVCARIRVQGVQLQEGSRPATSHTEVERAEKHTRRIFILPLPLALRACPPCRARRHSRLLVCSVLFLNSGDLSDDGPDPTGPDSDETPHCRLYFFSSRAGAGAGRGRWETTDAKSRLTTRPGIARGPVRASPELPACWMLRFAVRTSVAGWCQVRSVVSDMCACVGRAKGGSHRM
jgi:hypothetical protein